MIRASLLALFVLAFAGCTNWNEKVQTFATFKEFQLSPYAGKGFLPRGLVPASATDIRITVNMDTTEVHAEFDFDPQDEEGLAGAFVIAGKSADLLVRCGQTSLELLEISDHTHAKYQTSWDREVWTANCSRPPMETTKA